jgi:hypothetical protein
MVVNRNIIDAIEGSDILNANNKSNYQNEYDKRYPDYFKILYSKNTEELNKTLQLIQFRVFNYSIALGDKVMSKSIPPINISYSGAKSGGKKSSSKKPTSKKPSPKKPASKKPLTKKPSSKKPVSKK